MRLAGLEPFQIMLIHHLAPVQHDQAVGAGLLKVTGQGQRLIAGTEGQLVERRRAAFGQSQRCGRAADATGGRHLAGVAHGPAQVRWLKGVGLVDPQLRCRWEPLHHALYGRCPDRQPWCQRTGQYQGDAGQVGG
ncbi:hypothetical protein D3C80_1168190 [compost metagenome]